MKEEDAIRLVQEHGSFLLDHVSGIVYKSAKLSVYGSDERDVPIRRIRHEIDSLRELLDGLEEALGELDND